MNYIRIVLNNSLTQRTDSASKILVYDDVSMDGTSDIIQEYTARYPEKMKPLVQTENQYLQGIDNISRTFNLPRAREKYIFICDDDDCFLSPDKFQRQVDYMETHPNYALCIHGVSIDLVGKALTEDQMRSYGKNRVLPPKEIIDKPSGYAMSFMVFLARLVGDLPDYYVGCPVGDTPIQPIVATNGYGYYFDEAMSVYRVGVAGSWTVEGKNGDYQGKQRAYCDRIRRTYEQFDRAAGRRFKETTESATRRAYCQTVVSTKQSEEIFNPQYHRYYKELTLRIRFFLRPEYITSAVYGMVRKAFVGK